MEGEGEPCPKCGQGTLWRSDAAASGPSRAARATRLRLHPPHRPAAAGAAALRGRVPKNGDGHLVARRARRTGNVFYGCSRYPSCDFTTNDEPLGALHDADDGPDRAARRAWLCLRCGAAIPLPDATADPVGRRWPAARPTRPRWHRRAPRRARRPSAAAGLPRTRREAAPASPPARRLDPRASRRRRRDGR